MKMHPNPSHSSHCCPWMFSLFSLRCFFLLFNFLFSLWNKLTRGKTKVPAAKSFFVKRKEISWLTCFGKGRKSRTFHGNRAMCKGCSTFTHLMNASYVEVICLAQKKKTKTLQCKTYAQHIVKLFWSDMPKQKSLGLFWQQSLFCCFCSQCTFWCRMEDIEQIQENLEFEKKSFKFIKIKVDEKCTQNTRTGSNLLLAVLFWDQDRLDERRNVSNESFYILFFEPPQAHHF